MDSPNIAGLRIGHGYDAHRRMSQSEMSDNAAGTDNVSNKVLVLGGVTFPDEMPLVGHSDADVVCHAVIDALLNAADLGDIGQMFPDTDPAYAGANSLELLAKSAAAVSAAGWHLINADCTLIADRPMLAPHKPQMQRLLSEAARGPVTVSGKRTEGLLPGLSESPGTEGERVNGIVAFAVALLGRN